MKKILPSILSADFANLERDIKELESIGIDMFHIDVMDGNFVPNISFGFPIIESIRPKTDKVFDCHLMIANPENYVEQFCKVGCDMVSFHIESIKYLLPKLDYVLIMTVNPGFGGQKFITEMLEKIEELAKLREEKKYNFLIEVDGGINTETSKACRDKGADLLVCGSFLFGASDKEKTLGELLK